MSKLIGLCGRSGSGKGTLAFEFQNYHRFRIDSFALVLKIGCSELFDYPFEWNLSEEGKNKIIPGHSFTVRKALQVIGTEGGRSLDPDVWINIVRKKYYYNFYTLDTVIDDVRFSNEGAWIRSEGGILVKCVNHDHLEEPEHSSEDLSWLTDPDYIVTCSIVNSTGEGWGIYKSEVPHHAEKILSFYEEKIKQDS